MSQVDTHTHTRWKKCKQTKNMLDITVKSQRKTYLSLYLILLYKVNVTNHMRCSYCKTINIPNSGEKLLCLKY
jgi:hypothetical protein